MSAKLYALPNPPLSDIPAVLRNIADSIEAGEHGAVADAVFVLRGDELKIFGLGTADGTVAHYMLCCAAQKMQEPML